MDIFNRHTAKPTVTGTSGQVIFYDGTDFTDDFVGGKGIYVSNGTNWILVMSMNSEPKVYRAMLTQVGTSAPTAVVLKNTLSDEPVWSYFAVGRYRATLAGEFTQDKTFILLGHTDSTSVMIAYWVDVDTIEVNTANLTGAPANDFMYGSSIEISIYP